MRVRRGVMEGMKAARMRIRREVSNKRGRRGLCGESRGIKQSEGSERFAHALGDRVR